MHLSRRPVERVGDPLVTGMLTPGGDKVRASRLGQIHRGDPGAARGRVPSCDLPARALETEATRRRGRSDDADAGDDGAGAGASRGSAPRAQTPTRSGDLAGDAMMPDAHCYLPVYVACFELWALFLFPKRSH